MLYTEAQLDQYLARIRQYIPQMINMTWGWGRQVRLVNLFPPECVDAMDDFIVTEINELDACLRNHLWTAATLLAFRIFEDTIKVHVKYDLKKSIRNLDLKACINLMRKTCNQQYVNQMHELRKIRNRAMHPKDQFDARSAVDIVLQVCDITMFVYAIPASDQSLAS